MRTWTSFLALASLAWLAAPADSLAQPMGESMHLKSFSGMQNQYFFRGLPQVNQGMIMPAAAEIKADFVDDGWFTVAVPIGFGIVVAPGDKSEGIPNVPRAWYEARFDGGLILGFGGLDIDSRFTIYSSPNGSFKDVYEMTFHATFHDDRYWTDGDPKAVWRGLLPHAILARELIGARDGGVEGTYVELGLSPTLHIFEGGALFGIDLSFPMAMGLSAGDYYEMGDGGKDDPDHTLGYVSAAASLDFDCRFMPRRLGAWWSGVDVQAMFPVAAEDLTQGALDLRHAGFLTDTVEIVVTGRAGIAF